MKTCFLYSYFLNKFRLFLLLTILCQLLFTSCKCKRDCEGVDSMTEQLLSPGIKSAILGFPNETRWIFKRVDSVVDYQDTFFLSAQEIYPLAKGDCALMDKGKCCSDYYFEKSNRNLEVHSASGLGKFNSYFTDEHGFWIKGTWGAILIENHIYSQDFVERFNKSITLTLSGKTISDTNPGEQYLDESKPYIVHWSRQYGLVKYAYRTATDTLEYERIGLP